MALSRGDLLSQPECDRVLVVEMSKWSSTARATCSNSDFRIRTALLSNSTWMNSDRSSGVPPRGSIPMPCARAIVSPPSRKPHRTHFVRRSSGHSRSDAQFAPIDGQFAAEWPRSETDASPHLVDRSSALCCPIPAPCSEKQHSVSNHHYDLFSTGIVFPGTADGVNLAAGDAACRGPAST